MQNTFRSIVLFALVLTSCGGGSPYVGLWQCATDPTQSLEIVRFEEYFIITARDGEQQLKREGLFENEAFTVGTNNVGRSMALELRDNKISCTNPPNFCHCNSHYEKVDSLIHGAETETGQRDKDIPRPTVTEQDPASVEQIILERAPIILNLRNGGTVRVFNNAANAENEKRSHDWLQLKYYYLPHLELTKFPNGELAIVRENGDDVDVVLRLTASKIDKFELMESLHKALSHTQALPNLVLPLAYESITVEVPESSLAAPAVVIDSELDFENDPLEISLSILPQGVGDIAAKLKAGNEIVTAVNNGSALPVASIEIKQQSRAANMGESGPKRVTKMWPIAGQPRNP